MSIFKTIGETLSRLITGDKKTDGVDKNEILSLIDNNLILLKVVINTFDENPNIFKYIQSTLIPQNGSNKDNLNLLTLYNEYVKGLNVFARNLERTLILKSIRDAASLVLTDHEKIRDNFTSLFNQGTDISEIQADQMKLSHAAIFGYINLSTLMCDWFCFFYTNIIGQKGESPLRPAAYREQMITTSNKSVSDFVSDVIIRGKNRSILDVISSIRSAGDVTLYSKASTLDTYANINDYPGAMKLFGGYIKFQPILFVREFFTQLAHNKYKRNLALRDWMITKTAVLQMDLNGMSSDSPEYQKKLMILSKYGDEIARLDKIISQYETS